MTRVRTVERSRYRVYWGKATEFRQVMRFAADQGFLSAAGLNAVHCLISTTDAVLVYRQRIRSVGEGHLETVELLRKDSELPEIGKATGHLRKGLAKKNLVAYEDRELTPAEARELVDHAERLYSWAAAILPAVVPGSEPRT